MEEPAAPPILDSTQSTPPAARAVPHARPRVWPYLVAPLVALVAALLTGGIAAVAAAILSDSTAPPDESPLEFPVIAAALIASQITFVVTTLFFAMLSHDPSVRRMGFVRWRGSTSTVVLAVVGTLGVQFLIDIAATLLIDELSESLKSMTRMMLEPQGLAAVGMGFLISVLPGFCEETLYRGYMQRGLLRRWSPFAAIALTSVVFAAMHLDLQHSLFVLPLGAWLGFVAWRTGSVWPSVLGHFVNNLTAFVFLRLWEDPEAIGFPDEPAYYIGGVLLVACGVVAAFRLMRKRDGPEGQRSRNLTD